jgi:uncharacterized UBP type Zn finger protein
MTYNLSAVLLHLGRSASGGHYIAHIRDERSVLSQDPHKNAAIL